MSLVVSGLYSSAGLGPFLPLHTLLKVFGKRQELGTPQQKYLVTCLEP